MGYIVLIMWWFLTHQTLHLITTLLSVFGLTLEEIFLWMVGDEPTSMEDKFFLQNLVIEKAWR